MLICCSGSHSSWVTWVLMQLCHVLQYECHFKEAVKFIEECSSSWSSCSSFLYTHNWWHVALCYMEGHCSSRKVLEVYDLCIWKELERSDAVCAEVYLNALALLLRVDVRGELGIFEDRLRILASNLINQLAEAVYEYGKGDDKRALELLGPDFDAIDCKIIGASDEQVDVFNEIWYTMMLNTGQATQAIKVIEKWIKGRGGLSFLWRLLEQGYSMTGSQEAARAGERARMLETAYF